QRAYSVGWRVGRSMDGVDELLFLLNTPHQPCTIAIGEDIFQDVERIEVRMRQRDSAKRQAHVCLRDRHLFHGCALPQLRGLLWQTDGGEWPTQSDTKRRPDML